VINLRYHVVSITAVFLALGVGLAFGAAFIDQATVDVLEASLDNIEAQNTSLENENAAIEDQLDRLIESDARLRGDGLAELMAGHLADVPVLVLAVRGIDEDTVESATSAMLGAGARSVGVLWLTGRFLLDDESEVDDLADALGVSGGTADGLRSAARRQLASLLARAAAPAIVEPVEPLDPGLDPSLEPTTTSAPAEVGVPEPIQRLVDAGFLDYEAPAAGAADLALLAANSGLRLLVISGPGASVPDELVLLPIIGQASAGSATTPRPVVVAAQRGPEFDAAPPDGADPDAERVVFVSRIRDDEELRARVSTIDDLETFAGLAAVVLALEHGADGQYGHYGIGAGAQSLTPPPVDAGDGSG
jgi:hypothetical protein